MESRNLSSNTGNLPLSELSAMTEDKETTTNSKRRFMELIEKLESKVRTAIAKITQLEQHVEELEERNRVLEEESKSRDQKVEKLLMELDNLSIDHSTDDTLVERRETMEQLHKF